jgi:hypothetical protein
MLATRYQRGLGMGFWNDTDRLVMLGNMGPGSKIHPQGATLGRIFRL